MADNNNQEYNNLVSQKRSAQSQYSSCETRIENYDYLLRRLRSAKESIADLKDAFKDIKKSDKKTYEEKHDWKGTTHSTFGSKVSSLNTENENYYKNSIDYVLDSINNEITRLENERMNEYGLLGRLGSWINSLANKIENFFN